MRISSSRGERFTELQELPEALPPAASCGWALAGASSRSTTLRPGSTATLGLWRIVVDLHVSDLLNNQLPSHYDYTSWYDLLVFRRLAAGRAAQTCSWDDDARHAGLGAEGHALAIDTTRGFAVSSTACC